MACVHGPAYRPCPEHAHALARLPFTDAMDVARECPDCHTWEEDDECT